MARIPNNGSFRKGRAKTGGRTKGTPNKSTTQVGEFFRGVLNDPRWQDKMRAYLLTTPLDQLDKKIVEMAYHYGYGKPRERVVLEDPDGGPVSFVSLDFGRPRRGTNGGGNGHSGNGSATD